MARSTTPNALRIVGIDPYNPGREDPGGRRHAGGVAVPPPDTGFVIPDQPPRHRTQRADQHNPVRMNRDCEDTSTSTGTTLDFPGPTGIRTSGNHKSHCTWSPSS
ncbi:hypothetical protein ACW0JT_18170 [Arthrobacter sp. SA17]